ncbi:hypothetical protein B0H14DRAFT_2600170, partial [Mycena olivaceomarginata]
DREGLPPRQDRGYQTVFKRVKGQKNMKISRKGGGQFELSNWQCLIPAESYSAHEARYSKTSPSKKYLVFVDCSSFGNSYNLSLQKTLDGIVVSEPRPPAFTTEGLRDFLIEMIVTQDEVLSCIFDRRETKFHRLLKYLRPSIKDSDIPTRKNHSQRPNDWEIITEELAFMKIEGRHTGANLGSAILKILDRYGRRGKSGWITSGRRLSRQWLDSWSTMMCIEHAVNIAAKHFVQTVAPTPQKSLQKKLRNGELDEDEVGKLLSTLGDGSDTPESDAESRTMSGRQEMLSVDPDVAASSRVLEKLLYPGESTAELLLWVRTRWTSLYKCLERVLILRKPIDLFVRLADDREQVPPLRNKFYRDYTLSKRGWEKIQIIHDALRGTEPADVPRPSRARELRQCGVPKGRGNANIISILLPVLPDLGNHCLMMKPDTSNLQGRLTKQAKTLATRHTNLQEWRRWGWWAWFQRGEIRSILDIKTSQLGTNDNSEYFSTCMTIVFMKPDAMWYPTCQKPDCNKKFIDNGGWSMEVRKMQPKLGASQIPASFLLRLLELCSISQLYYVLCLGVQATKTKVLRGILKFESSAGTGESTLDNNLADSEADRMGASINTTLILLRYREYPEGACC